LRPKEIAALGLSVAMHALGHAGLALAAGASARALMASMAPTLPGLASAVAGKEGASVGAPPDALGAALAAAVVGLAAATAKALGGAHASYVQARLSAEVGAALRLAVLDQWLDASANGVGRARHLDQGVANAAPGGRPEPLPGARSTGALARGVTAMTGHVREVEAGVRVGALGGVRAVAQLVPLVAALVWLAPRLAVVALAAVAPFALALALVRRRTRGAHVRATSDAEALLEAADEAVRHADLWRSYGAQSKVRAHVASLGAAQAARAARVEGASALLSGANEVMAALALVLAIAAARAGWFVAATDGATLVAFAATFFLAYRPLRDLGDARMAWARASAAYEAIAPLCARVLTRRDDLGSGRAGDVAASDAHPRGSPWPSAALEVRGLELSRGRAARCSFRVEPGQIVAVVGENGVGKTTLLRTLLGLDDARGGAILFDGEDLVSRPAGPDGRPFAWVPQEAPLLADTLASNVRLGGEADPARVLGELGAGRLAGALGGERLGAGGRAVSGGERQWIALARALATRQPVLLLDEPTSGLDAASQAHVLDAIARLRGRRSVLLVTHRPEPLAVADAVIELATA